MKVYSVVLVDDNNKRVVVARCSTFGAALRRMCSFRKNLPIIKDLFSVVAEII